MSARTAARINPVRTCISSRGPRAGPHHSTAPAMAPANNTATAPAVIAARQRRRGPIGAVGGSAGSGFPHHTQAGGDGDGVSQRYGWPHAGQVPSATKSTPGATGARRPRRSVTRPGDWNKT
jgi:hypothetical protein